MSFDIESSPSKGALDWRIVMPKLKSHRGVAKRFKVSGTGKIRHKRAGKSHLLTKKDRRVKRHMKDTVTVNPGDAWALKKLIPYDA
jgi:large subunit ribosomal protein L35